MKPKSRPQESKSQVLARLKSAGIQATQSVFLVAVRGYYLNTMGAPGVNDIGIYDDAIFLVTPNGIQSFNANTDPSKQVPGIATLVPGLHLYKLGKHGISRPGGGYPAFRPATPDESLPVTRAGRDGVYKGIAINIHKGGYTKTSSEGCQTVWPDQWAEFYREVTTAMRREGQREIEYALLVNT